MHDYIKYNNSGAMIMKISRANSSVIKAAEIFNYKAFIYIELVYLHNSSLKKYSIRTCIKTAKVKVNKGIPLAKIGLVCWNWCEDSKKPITRTLAFK